MDDRTKELIAIGAAISANCQPYLQYLVKTALDNGIEEGEIAVAIEVGKMVRKGAISKMDEFASKIIKCAASDECGCQK